jgi:6-phosphogluconolactonase
MIHVFRDAATLARVAVRNIAQIGTRSVAERGKFDLVLSGGNTPCQTYRALAEATHDNHHLWNHTHIFWGDERWVPEDHRASNYRMARICLLDLVNIPSTQICPIPTQLSDPQGRSAV